MQLNFSRSIENFDVGLKNIKGSLKMGGWVIQSKVKDAIVDVDRILWKTLY